MSIKIHDSWKSKLNTEFEKPYFQDLTQFVRTEYKSSRVYPPAPKIFAAFDLCPFDDVKVVLIGQDPYHGEGQANGLCFSVEDGIALPPSLKNIYKEIDSDLGRPSPTAGDLSYWAEQGVLLLNATLTVRANQAGSHQGKGWEEFTDQVIESVSKTKRNIVFLLWGSFAKKKEQLIDRTKGHLILEAAHPSPFSADKGFFGCKHFSKTNQFLKANGLSEIDW